MYNFTIYLSTISSKVYNPVVSEGIVGRVKRFVSTSGAASYIKGIFESQYLRIRKQISSRDN